MARARYQFVKLRIKHKDQRYDKWEWKLVDTKTGATVAIAFGNNPINPPPWIKLRQAQWNTSAFFDPQPERNH